jgi:hypothetical protein
MIYEQFKTSNTKLRENIIDTLKVLRDKVVKLYGEDEPDGFIRLETGYSHNYFDDHMTEVINGVHSSEDMVLGDYNTDTRDIFFDEVSNDVLIEIIGELESMIKNPKTIEIF